MNKKSKLSIVVFIACLFFGCSKDLEAQVINFTTSFLVNDIAVDSTDLWAATQGGIARINLATGQKTIYTAANSGLTRNGVNSVLIDASGVKWFGAEDGLHKFDGITWTYYHYLSNGDTLFNITTLRTDSFGRIFAQNYNRSLVIINGANDSSIYFNQLPLAYSPFDFDVDSLGNIWFAFSYGVVYFDGVNWIIYDTSNTVFAYDEARRIKVDNNGTVWATVNYYPSFYGLYKFDGVNWTQTTGANAAQAAQRKIYVDEANNKYFYNDQYNGVYIYNDTTWTIYTSATGQIGQGQITALATKNNHLYTSAFFSTTVYDFDGNNLVSFPVNAYDFSSNYCNSVARAENDMIWTSNDNGINFTNGITFGSISLPVGMSYINKIRFDHQGNLWCISWDNDPTTPGVAMYDGNIWTVFPYNYDFDDITFKPNGDIWFATANGLMKYDGNIFLNYAVNDPLSPGTNDPLNSVCIDYLGDVWFADYYGFGKFNGNTFTFYNASTLPFLNPYNNYLVLSDSIGNIWTYTDYGGSLVKYDGSTWTLYNSGNSSWTSDTYLRSLFDRGNGIIWFGTDDGIVKYDGTNFINYDYETYHLGGGAWDIIMDANNNLWYAGYNWFLGVFNPDGIEHLEIEPFPKITGTTYFDANTNGTLDTTDIGLPQQTVLLQPDSIFRLSNSAGNYSFYVDTGNYSITYLLTTNWNLTIAINPYNVYADSVYNCCYDFGLQPQNVVHQMNLSLINTNYRCSSIVPFWMDIYNSGTVPENVRCYFVLDTLTAFVSAFPPVTASSGDTLFWDMNGCAPFSHHQVLLQLQTPNQNFNGDTISIYGGVISLANGFVFDTDSINDKVTCAFDPNDKTVRPAGIDILHYTLMDDTLTYTIRFQNTGTDTALTVAIYDTLDANLDMNTFQFIASSHAVDVKYDAKGRVRFGFYGIQLPDSNTNEIASHGFVRYSIKAKQGIPDPTVVNNKASILFDFNVPVLTNSTFNTLVNQFPVGINSIQQNNTVLVYPNPAKDFINFKMSTQTNSFDLMICDLYGRLVYHKIETGNFVSIPAYKIGEGIFVYRLRTNGNNIYNGKVILIE